MVTVLNSTDVETRCDIQTVLPTVEDALIKQAAGEVERPERPHYPVGNDSTADEPSGTALTMPAYIYGNEYYVTKLASVHEGNEARSLPTVQAQISLTDAETGVPVAYMPGTRITNARTGCVGGIAAREIATNPVRLAVIGAGTQARWQTRAIAETCELESVAIYSPSDSKDECAKDLREAGIPAHAAESAAEAVSDATVIVTATTSTEPVFPAAKSKAELVVAVGAYNATMQELEPALIDRAGMVFADVPDEAIETGDLRNTSIEEDDIAPLADAITGAAPTGTEDAPVVVKSVGSAVMDLAAATAVYDAAEADGVGTKIDFEEDPA